MCEAAKSRGRTRMREALSTKLLGASETIALWSSVWCGLPRAWARRRRQDRGAKKVRDLLRQPDYPEHFDATMTIQLNHADTAWQWNMVLGQAAAGRWGHWCCRLAWSRELLWWRAKMWSQRGNACVIFTESSHFSSYDNFSPNHSVISNRLPAIFRHYSFHLVINSECVLCLGIASHKTGVIQYLFSRQGGGQWSPIRVALDSSLSLL